MEATCMKLTAVDRQGSGVITYAEFVNFLAVRWVLERKQKDLETYFKLIDVGT